MRTRSFSFIAMAAALLISVSMAEAKVYKKNWQFSKDITMTSKEKAVAVPLDDEVYSGSRADLADLRIIDEGASEIPFVIITQDASPAQRRLPAKVLLSETGELETSLVAELVGKMEPFNSIVLIPKTTNFLRKITLEGSNDLTAWTVIRSASPVYSFDTTMRRTYLESYTNETYAGFSFGVYWERNLRVVFPDCEYKYLRVKVPHGKDKAPVELRDIEIYSQPKFEAAEDRFECRIVRSDVPAGGKSVEILADCGHKNLHITRIEMDTNRTNFFRSVDVETSADLKEWKNLASGAIYKISVDEAPQEDMSIRVPESRDRYIRIRIKNGDNPPVTLSGVRCYGKKRYAAFMPEDVRGYKLLYGNPRERMPSYDVSYLLRDKNPLELSRAELGKQIETGNYEPVKEPAAWHDRKPYLLWMAMAVIALGIIFLASQVIKKSR